MNSVLLDVCRPIPLTEDAARCIVARVPWDVEYTDGFEAWVEPRIDTHVSTLRNCVRSLGGEIDIVARFPDGDVRNSQFGDIAHD